MAALLVVMTVSVFHTRAAAENLNNPYDSAHLSVSQIIDVYHFNMNEEMNGYIKMMLVDTADTKSDHANGKPLASPADCYKHPKNFSTYCIALNMLGADSDQCDSIPDDKKSPDMVVFCKLKLGKSDIALNGFMNFKAALTKKMNQQIFETNQQQQKWYSSLAGAWDSPTALRAIFVRKQDIPLAISQAKETLDQALSATSLRSAIHEPPTAATCGKAR